MGRVLISLFLGLVAFSATSNEKVNFETYMKEYMEVMGSTSNTKLMLSNMLKMQKQNLKASFDEIDNNTVDMILDTMEKHYNENYLNEDYLLHLYSPVFQKYYSAQDMQKIIEFYRTPVGKKFIQNQVVIQNEVMSQLQQDLQKGGIELQSKIKNILGNR